MLVLGAITVLGIVLAGVILPRFSGTHFDGHAAAVMTQIMFPVVLLLGLSGVLTGILQSYDEFSIPALAPVVWNGVILILLLLLHDKLRQERHLRLRARMDHRGGRADVADRLGAAPDRLPPRLPCRLARSAHPPGVRADAAGHDRPGHRQPGRADQLDDGRARQRATVRARSSYAFLLYMLPQGVFSVAVSTVLFPTLSRQAARGAPAAMRQSLGNGMRQINLLLIPSAAGMMALSRPIVRLVFMRGAVQHGVAGSDLRGALLVRMEPAVRRPEPADDTHVLRASAAVAPDQAGGDQHDRRHRRQRRALQAIGYRRPGDRHRQRQHRDGSPAAAAPADRVQRPPGPGADRDDHRPDPRRRSRSRAWSRG